MFEKKEFIKEISNILIPSLEINDTFKSKKGNYLCQFFSIFDVSMYLKKFYVMKIDQKLKHDYASTYRTQLNERIGDLSLNFQDFHV